MPHSRRRKQKQSSERRIKTSRQGRIAFRPGREHPLDVQFDEARLAKEHLDTQMAHIAESLGALETVEDLSARIEAEDEALRQFLSERYHDFFHQEHIEATFLALRRKRTAARLQAAKAALDLAYELLEPDTFVEQLVDLMHERPAQSIEANQAQLTGHAQTARDQLAAYETRLQEIRNAITRGNGWIEQFYINKTGFRPEVIKLAYALWEEREQGIPVPAEVLAPVHPEIAECLRERKPIPLRLKEQATQDTAYGPYYKYRWREGSGPIYTISLGRISDRPEGLLPFKPYLRFAKENEKK